MTVKQAVLYALLSADGFCSGEALAQQLGKSRAAIWKAVRALKAEGYAIEAVTNRGYRLTEQNNLLSAESVAAKLGSPIEVLYYPTIDSTNNECKRLLANGKAGAFLVVADEQTAGRGRQGKSFYSPPLTGVYFSLVIRPDATLQNAVTATTAAAVAVCRAIEALTPLAPKIKWVNDVYLNDKKVCGILTEAVTDFESGMVDSVIIGIGINIQTLAFPKDVQNAGALGVSVSRSALTASIADNLLQIAGGDYKLFIAYYRAHSLVLGRRIVFLEQGKKTNATALAIDETGGLEVELDSGEKRVLRSGEISIRPLER